MNQRQAWALHRTAGERLGPRRPGLPLLPVPSHHRGCIACTVRSPRLATHCGVKRDVDRLTLGE
uniref:Uncharacterized protein n=1 Tax=Oryza barthii TaxID=65489 RepID=A0A0D3F894_9ORYZ